MIHQFSNGPKDIQLTENNWNKWTNDKSGSYRDIVKYITENAPTWETTCKDTNVPSLYFTAKQTGLPVKIEFFAPTRDVVIHTKQLKNEGNFKKVYLSVDFLSGERRARLKHLSFIIERKDLALPMIEENEFLQKFKGIPGIVKNLFFSYYLRGEKTPRAHFIQPYYQETLSELIRSQLDPKKTETIVICLLSALREIHAKKEVHLDIKGDNILLEIDEHGSVISVVLADPFIEKVDEESFSEKAFRDFKALVDLLVSKLGSYELLLGIQQNLEDLDEDPTDDSIPVPSKEDFSLACERAWQQFDLSLEQLKKQSSSQPSKLQKLLK